MDEMRFEARELRSEMRALRREIGDLHLTIIRIAGLAICVLGLGMAGLVATRL